MAWPPGRLLAGGMATASARSRKCPKLLVEVAGEPFFSHQLRLLRAAGLTRKSSSASATSASMIVNLYGDGTRYGVSHRLLLRRPQTPRHRRRPHPRCPKLGDAFYVLYGDSYLP
jgi:hypothetical protein